jgi:hypothetical protein
MRKIFCAAAVVFALWPVLAPVAANDGYEDYVRRVERRPFALIEGLKNIQRFMKARNPKIAELPPERFIDETILRELDTSGFLDQALAAKAVR